MKFLALGTEEFNRAIWILACILIALIVIKLARHIKSTMRAAPVEIKPSAALPAPKLPLKITIRKFRYAKPKEIRPAKPAKLKLPKLAGTRIERAEKLKKAISESLRELKK